MVQTALPPAPAPASADIFLHVQTKRAGKVKGEAVSPGHVDDIIVTGWHWGLTASSAIGSTQATSRRSYTALTVHKRIDLATTGLMSALATNDEVKQAKLTMRRAGGVQEDFLVVTLEAARVIGLQHDAGPGGEVQETLQLAFTKVEVEYRAQRASGQRAGAAVFTDELPQN